MIVDFWMVRLPPVFFATLTLFWNNGITGNGTWKDIYSSKTTNIEGETFKKKPSLKDGLFLNWTLETQHSMFHVCWSFDLKTWSCFVWQFLKIQMLQTNMVKPLVKPSLINYCSPRCDFFSVEVWCFLRPWRNIEDESWLHEILLNLRLFELASFRFDHLRSDCNMTTRHGACRLGVALFFRFGIFPYLALPQGVDDPPVFRAATVITKIHKIQQKI